MKKLFTLSIGLFALLFVANAQEEFKMKKYNTLHFPNKTIIENEEYSVSIKDIIGEKNVCKLAIVIENKTNDYLVFQEDQCSFVFETGEQKLKSREHLIQPYKTITKTLEVMDNGTYKVKNFTFNFGGLSKISSKGSIVSAPNFTLPETINSFTAGDYEVSLRGKKKETQVTTVTFSCLYSGNSIGLINASKLSVMIEGGQMFANNNKKAKTKMLQPGDKAKVIAVFNIPAKIVDMQFADLSIVWNDTFKTSDKIDLNITQPVNLALDIELTKEKK